jgi:uncharacterized protein YcgI (DUF1989 family)
MAWKVVKDLVVPRCTGKTIRVNKGEIFRVIEYEGKQVLDLTFVNAHNYKERFAAELSAVLNSMQGLGGYYRLTKLYSKPPYENIMATVMDDMVGSGSRGGQRAGHFMIGHCSNRLLELWGLPGARTCSDNFADAYSEIGIKLEDTYTESIFNVWMQSWIDEDGNMNFGRPLAETGDYTDFLAEMDLIAIFSLCPFEISSCNDFRAKALRFQVLEWQDGLRTMGWAKDLTEKDLTKPV